MKNTNRRPRRDPAAAVRLLLPLALLAGIALAPSRVDGRSTIRVVATLPNLASIAREIGGPRLEITTIAAGTQDAHFVDPKPSFIVKLRAADLLLVNGLDLEIGWIPPLTQGARTARLLPGGRGYVDCSMGIRVTEVPVVLSRSEGDVHPYGNPHYLADPLNAEIVAGTIAEALKRVDPENAAAYEEGRRAFVKRLHSALFGPGLVELAGGAKLAREAGAGSLDAFLDGTSVDGRPLRARLGGWLGRLQPFRGRPLVTYHKDFSYFAARFAMPVVAYVEPKPGIPPSAKHLEEVAALLSRREARVLVTRPYVEHRSTDMLARRTGAAVVTLPLEAGGAPGTDDYFRLFDHVTATLAGAFAGEGS